MAPPHNHCGSSVSSSDLYPTNAMWGYSPDFAFLPPTTVRWKSLQVETFSVKLKTVIVSYVKSKYSRHSLEEGGRRLVNTLQSALDINKTNIYLISYFFQPVVGKQRNQIFSLYWTSDFVGMELFEMKESTLNF